MKLRTIACLIGALAISSAPFVLAVTGGGLPSFPSFQGVSIGGNNSQSCPQGTAAAVVCATGTVNNGEVVIQNLSTGVNAVGLTVLGGSSSSNKAFRVFNNNATSEFLDIDGTGVSTFPSSSVAQVVNLKGLAAGAANSVFMGFVDSGGTRTGYVGDSGPNSNISLGCDIAACTVELNANNLAGTIALNAATITSAASTVPWLTQTTATTTPTVTAGCTTTPSVTFRFVKIGSTVTVETDGFSCTSNAVTMFIPGTLPSAAYEPAHQTACMLLGTDSGKTGITPVFININTNSTEVDPQVALSASNQWTASGIKGLSASSCSYSLL